MSTKTSISLQQRTNEIDPEIRRFVETTTADSIALAGKSPMTMARRRQIAEQVRAPWRQGGPKMAEVKDFHIGPNRLRARVYVPQSGPGAGTLIYLHGGGWTLFSIDTHDRLMREYAERAGCAVVGLDYSLSPEHRFPKAILDTCDLIKWLHENKAQLGLNMDKYAIGGDSAGGNLSLTTALILRDRGDALPDALLLNYAALDTDPRPSYELYDGDPYMLNADEMKVFWSDYLGASTTDDPYARPLLADLKGLPPMHLCIAECDILRDENLELRDRLKAAGVEVSAIIYPGATHSFLEAVKSSTCANRAIDDASLWLKQILSS